MKCLRCGCNNGHVMANGRCVWCACPEFVEKWPDDAPKAKSLQSPKVVALSDLKAPDDE